ncbi:hypothetical protein SCMU_20590 [Sinomonas cyclohexanicum]|uniref:Uncharacterized protein n=1 Tax=Sinomonas cyclohexanicum TaxID=322009 RepID=A0ABN6FH58_SINCY|nr:DUF5703 family protein [Corynebacterium cyclohexanicum]BCT76217.1 hypothetical protein SCMU_20590 [Corynebacterium cyclohexanicum]
MKERILSTAESPGLGTRSAGPGRAYEYLVLSVGPGDSVAEARQRVREHSEYGKWELERSRLYIGGGRQYLLRRKVMLVERTA